MTKFNVTEDLGTSSASNDPCDELLKALKLIRSACEEGKGWVSKWGDYLEDRPPFDKLRDADDADFVPFYVELLDWHYGPLFNRNAASALAAIASRSSQHAKLIIDNGALHPLVHALSYDCDLVVEKAADALGDIADASPGCRDKVLEEGALEPLLSILNQDSESLVSVSDPWRSCVLRSAAEALSNLCRSMPSPPFEKVKAALPVLETLIFSDDELVVANACWTLYDLLDGHMDKMQTVIDARFLPQLVKLLQHPSDFVVVPALKALGHIVSNDAQVLIDNNMLPCLYDLLTQNHKHDDDIKEDACWIVSNIAAGNSAQVQAVSEADIFVLLIHHLKHGKFDVKKWAARAISFATSKISHELISSLVNEGCIKPLCDLLTCSDPMIVKVCLMGLKNILEVGEADKVSWKPDGVEVNFYAIIVGQCDGFRKIKDLCAHDNADINKNAMIIFDRYWAEDKEGEDLPNGGGGYQGFLS